MDVIGNEIIKGTVEKQINKLAGDDKPEDGIEEEDGLTREEEKILNEKLKEKTEKMMKIQAKRRAERAKAREEMREKHNLKPNEDDQKILEDASTASRFSLTDSDGENSVQQVASSVLSKLRDTWDDVKKVLNVT